MRSNFACATRVLKSQEYVCMCVCFYVCPQQLLAARVYWHCLTAGRVLVQSVFSDISSSNEFSISRFALRLSI